jgi:hypothetical protein
MHGGSCGSGYPSDSDAAGGGGVVAAGRPAGDWNGRPRYRCLDLHHGGRVEELRLRLRLRAGLSARIRHRLGQLGLRARSLESVGPSGPSSESPYRARTQTGAVSRFWSSCPQRGRGIACSTEPGPAGGWETERDSHIYLHCVRLACLTVPHRPRTVALCGHVACVAREGCRLGRGSELGHSGSGGRPRYTARSRGWE